MTLMLERLPAEVAEGCDTNARLFVETLAVALQEGDEAVFEYDPVSRVYAIEHESRDGFWSWNGGGYEVCLPASLYHAWGSGSAPAPIAPLIAYGNESIAEEWARQHPERPSLVDCICADDGEPAAEWREEAQEWEMGGWQADDDCYYWKARAIFYAPSDHGNTTGRPEVYLDCYLCSDSYGRDNISWLPYAGGGKADQTSGSFKVTLPAEAFAKARPDQVLRMVECAMRKLPEWVTL